MHFNDINDDLGTARKPFSVIACIPVLGRHPLLKQTIKRLLQKNGAERVICVGHQSSDRDVCESMGALWVSAANKPLGKKWNIAFHEAKQFYPDACLYVGSSDWVSDDWIFRMQPYIEKYNFVGTPGMYLLDINGTMRMCHWAGYTGSRQNETIGIGRMLSADLLSKLHWHPFNDVLDNSLDRSMKDNAAKYGFSDHMVTDERLKSLSISTNQWVNKHFFNHHWNNMLPSNKLSNVKEFLELNFPEAFTVYEAITSVHQQ
jgi:hypothetical protein